MGEPAASFDQKRIQAILKKASIPDADAKYLGNFLESLGHGQVTRDDLEALQKNMDVRFEAVDVRFDAIDVRFEALEKTMDGKFEAVRSEIVASAAQQARNTAVTAIVTIVAITAIITFLQG